MGDIYNAQEEYEKALLHYQQALEIGVEVGDGKAVINARNSIGDVYVRQGKPDEAIREHQQGLKMAKESGFMTGLRDSYRGLSEAFEAKRDLTHALDYFKLFTAVNDSLQNIEKQEKVALLHTQYETQKKDEEITLLNARNAVQQSENRKQKVLRNAFIAGFGLVLLLVFVLYNSYRLKTRSNKELEAKNKVIHEQKLLVEEALTELQESEKQLIQAEKMASLGQLTAGIAHEINNPINFVSGNINPLKRNFTELKEVLERYQQLLSDTQQKEELSRLRKEYDV
jgi:signal transduction histidine kinase